MKKFLALALAMVLSFAVVGCGSESAPSEEAAPSESVSEEAAPAEGEATEAPAEGEATEAPAEGEAEEVKVMNHEEFMAAELESEVCVETYVQGKQSYYAEKGTATIYAQSEDGAYFLYNAAVSEEDYEKLVPGAKIKVTGFKAEWSGEVEIIDAKVEILEGSFVPEVLDATELLGTEEIIAHQNELVAFNGLTVEKVEYKGEKGDGDDLYVTLKLNDASYNFCVESYLTDAESEVYKTVEGLKEGDVVDVEGFLYWYEGVNPHITAITVK